jgi:hypothetical protein
MIDNKIRICPLYIILKCECDCSNINEDNNNIICIFNADKLKEFNKIKEV